jgi:hypothetical protein
MVKAVKCIRHSSPSLTITTVALKTKDRMTNELLIDSSQSSDESDSDHDGEQYEEEGRESTASIRDQYDENH